MTERELKEIKLLDLEIKRVESVIQRFKKTKYDIAFEERSLKKLSEYKNKLINKKIETENFIQNIDDAEIRLILALKFVDLKSWNYIARTLHYDRSTVYYKFKNFIKSKKN